MLNCYFALCNMLCREGLRFTLVYLGRATNALLPEVSRKCGECRENGGEWDLLEKFLVFCGKMGATLHEKPKKPTFCTPWEEGGGVY